MTVPTQIRLVEYPGDDSSTVFPYPFKVFIAADMVVTLIDGAMVETIQTLGVHYTISGLGLPQGGNVTMLTAPATGETLRIERTLPLTQITDLRNQGTFLPQNIEDALDRLVMMLQALAGGTIVVTGNDADAIHDNVAGEINAIAAKVTPALADELVIEDSAAGWAKKKITLTGLGAVLTPQYYTDSPETRPALIAANKGLSYYVQNAGGNTRRETIYEKATGGTYARKIEWQTFD
jgi:hypothetical protein